MLKSLNFAFVLHNHQPIGNLPWIFEDVYKLAYNPFLETLEKHPQIKVALHYSGIILQWLIENHPEYIAKLKKLIKQGQVEILTGGFYEPILPLIPDSDKLRQIKKLIDFIEEKLGFIPQGLWLTERIWEPNLAKPLSEAKVKYILIDDTHFKKAGLKEEETFGYYITEEQGYFLKVFPINKFLRYNIPFEPSEKSIDYLKTKTTEYGENILIFADDGEKFGAWPGTNKWVYQEKWLGKFFKIIEENNDWLNIILPSEYLDCFPAKGRIYLPCCAYSEMLEWSDGYFRNFLVKYPEANNLHKKMIYVSNKLKEISKKKQTAKNKKVIEEAYDELMKSQCNDVYWHGVFGGLYFNFLRRKVYNSLIKAEVLIDSIFKKEEYLKIEEEDFDKDGNTEILLTNKFISMYISPDYGGSLFELDYKPKFENLINTLSKKKENYHFQLIENILKERGNGFLEGEEIFHYDWYKKFSLLDHFLRADTNLLSFKNANYGEQGDFVNQPYQYSYKILKEEIKVFLIRDGNIWWGEHFLPLQLEKQITIFKKIPDIEVSYHIKNLSQINLELWFALEFNLSLADKNNIFYKTDNIKKFTGDEEIEGIEELQILDDIQKIKISFQSKNKTTFWIFPQETISRSEKGVDYLFQNITILLNYKFNLPPDKTWNNKLVLKINDF